MMPQDAPPPRPARLRRWLRNTLLVPVAVLLILIEDVLWAGALAILRALRQWRAVQAVHTALGRLPVQVVLPLFLVPEAASYAAGFYATFLLAQGHLAAAIGMIGVKCACKLVIVWIYTACEATLLRVAWFAWLHHQATRALAWAKQKIAPLRAYTRALLPRARLALRLGPGRAATRLRALRLVLARRFRGP